MNPGFHYVRNRGPDQTERKLAMAEITEVLSAVAGREQKP
jgi:hypothetical protein